MWQALLVSIKYMAPCIFGLTELFICSFLLLWFSFIYPVFIWPHALRFCILHFLYFVNQYYLFHMFIVSHQRGISDISSITCTPLASVTNSGSLITTRSSVPAAHESLQSQMMFRRWNSFTRVPSQMYISLFSKCTELKLPECYLQAFYMFFFYVAHVHFAVWGIS